MKTTFIAFIRSLRLSQPLEMKRKIEGLTLKKNPSVFTEMKISYVHSDYFGYDIYVFAFSPFQASTKLGDL
jgi:hypothetical protein